MVKFRKLHCSFCRKSETEVAKLVAGPRVYICDSCVTIVNRIIINQISQDQPVTAEATLWRKLVDRVRQLFQQMLVNPVRESG